MMLRGNRCGSADLAYRFHDEVELQSDVMRFMALIALCLVAVLALVREQSAGGERDLRPLLLDRALVQRQLERLQSRLSAVNAELSESERLLSEISLQLSQREEQLGEAIEQHRSMAEQVAVLHRSLELKQRASDDIERRLGDNMTRLSLIQQAVAAEEKTLSRMERRSVELFQSIETLQAGSDAAGSPDTEVAQEQQEQQDQTVWQSVDNIDVAIPEVEPVQDSGYTLRFESDRVLLELVNSGTVKLYVRAGDAVWQLRDGDFRHAAAPAAWYEMSAETVPYSLVTGFRRNSGVQGSADVWGVVLPAETSRQIQARIQQSNGGALVIGGAADVELE